MKLDKRKYLKVFFLGAAVGIIVVMALFAEFFDYNPTLSKLFQIISVPAQPLIWLGDQTMRWYCPTSTAHNDLCGGLGFDGGPLMWIELTYFFGSFPIAYGILAVLAFSLWSAIRQNRKIAQN